MADIFISYARPDEARASALQQRLVEAGWTVWRDARLESGEDYRAQIAQALDEARVTIVLWSAAACESNWVRSEASRAANRKRLMAARLEDVEPPLGLDQYQATNLIGYHAGEAHGGVDTLLAQLAERLGRTEPQREDDDARAMRRLRRRLREAKTSTLLSLAALPVVLLLQGSGMLDSVLQIDSRMRELSLQARYLFLDRSLAPELAVVVVDDQTVERLEPQQRDGQPLGRFGANWRTLHAEALDRLVAAGAKVVAFDIAFPVPSTPTPLADAGTQRLADSMQRARVAGTSVVIAAIERRADGSLSVDPRVRDALSESPAKGGAAPGVGYVASPCTGFRSGGATSAALLTTNPAGPHPGWLGLSLAAVQSYWGLATNRVGERVLLLSGASGARDVAIAGKGRTLDAVPSDCRVMRVGDQPAELLLDLYPTELTRGHPRVVMFEDVLQGKDLAAVQGKIVLLGTQLGAGARIDRHDVFQCGTTPWSCGSIERWGMNLQLDAMNNLLQGSAITALAPEAQLGWMLVLCIATAWWRMAHGQRAVWVQRAGMIAAMVIALVVSAGAAIMFQVLMDSAYQVLAIGATYFAVARLDR